MNKFFLMIAAFFLLNEVHAQTSGKVKDAAGNEYPWVLIEDMKFMASNLATDKFSDGTPIANVTNPTKWTEVKTPACSDVDNLATNTKIYGKLYNKAAITDPKGICPKGWHVATEKEYQLIFSGQPQYDKIALSMREKSDLWKKSGEFDKVTNATGFSARPAGKRTSSGEFTDKGLFAYFYAVKDKGLNRIELLHNYSGPNDTYASDGEGISCRCVENY